MKPRVRIETYARRVSVPLALAEMLWDKIGLLRLKNEGSEWRSRPGDIIFNWGCSSSRHLNTPGIHWVNHPDKVAAKTSKLYQYRKFAQHGVPSLVFTTDPNEVVRRQAENGRDWYARIRDNSFGGRGIVLIPAGSGGDIPPAAVYTERFRAKLEYRIHVFDGRVIDVTQKRRRHGAQPNAVRSWGNGYVFCRDNMTPPPQEALDASIAAVKALGLDFGGVDILVKEQVKEGQQRVAVLEVNSAPGIEGTTLDKYAEAITQYVQARVA